MLNYDINICSTIQADPKFVGQIVDTLSIKVYRTEKKMFLKLYFCFDNLTFEVTEILFKIAEM